MKIRVKNNRMQLSDFDYALPENLIAQMPADKRENSKMLVLDRQTQALEHKHFFDIVDYLDENCILVLNNTKVLPARLYGTKDTGAKIEVFLLHPSSKMGKMPNTYDMPINKQENLRIWSCLIKPSKRVKPDTIITVCDKLQVRPVKKQGNDGEWLVELIYEGDLFKILHEAGNIPLPPYIERKLQTDDIKQFDIERYQTVYAKDEGSVAAPTAGLHFTEEILEKLQSKGVEIAYVTLNVGLGTFRPVRCENISDHKMHSEIFAITQDAAQKINNAKSKGKKVAAVGTTTVRTLETAYQKYGCIKACHDSSELFIYPPYEFKVTDKLITNFHLPKSTLLMLAAAFAGKDFIFKAYKNAIENQYRFFSYGDCMFIS